MFVKSMARWGFLSVHDQNMPLLSSGQSARQQGESLESRVQMSRDSTR